MRLNGSVQWGNIVQEHICVKCLYSQIVGGIHVLLSSTGLTLYSNCVGGCGVRIEFASLCVYRCGFRETIYIAVCFAIISYQTLGVFHIQYNILVLNIYFILIWETHFGSPCICFSTNFNDLFIKTNMLLIVCYSQWFY